MPPAHGMYRHECKTLFDAETNSTLILTPVAERRGMTSLLSRYEHTEKALLTYNSKNLHTNANRHHTLPINHTAISAKHEQSLGSKCVDTPALPDTAVVPFM